MDAVTKEIFMKAEMYERNKPPVQCTFYIYHNTYAVPVDHSETDTGDDFYYYIDGMHGKFEPISSELLLETANRTEAEQLLDKLENEMETLRLDRRKMPETVKIEQYDLRVRDAEEDKSISLEDRLTKITIDHEPDDPWEKQSPSNRGA